MGVVDHFGQGLPTGCFETQPTFFLQIWQGWFLIAEATSFEVAVLLEINYKKT